MKLTIDKNGNDLVFSFAKDTASKPQMINLQESHIDTLIQLLQMTKDAKVLKFVVDL